MRTTKFINSLAVYYSLLWVDVKRRGAISLRARAVVCGVEVALALSTPQLCNERRKFFSRIYGCVVYIRWAASGEAQMLPNNGMLCWHQCQYYLQVKHLSTAILKQGVYSLIEANSWLFERELSAVFQYDNSDPSLNVRF